MQAAIIPADSTQPIRFVDLDAGLDPMQEAVGGDIQLVGLRAASMNLYANENGKLEGRPVNRRATILCHTTLAIADDDFIVGDAVLVGPTDDEAGEDTSLTDAHMAFLTRFDQKVLLLLGQHR